MAKVVKKESDLYKRVQDVFDFMDEKQIRFEVVCNELRVFDTSGKFDKELVLMTAEMEHETNLPPTFDGFNLKVWNT